jgi:hypothetical protein
MRRLATIASVLLAASALTMGGVAVANAATSAGRTELANHAISAASATVVPNAALFPDALRASRALLEPDAATSTFYAYTKEGFGGKGSAESGCGVHNIPQPVNSYVFVYLGQHVHMYNCLSAGCGVNFTFTGSASSRTGVGWKSMDVIC